jgi:3',5'-cyclic AMP phosphodiesterase CpdA
VLEEFLPTLKPGVIVVSGDISLRARHGEFQAAARFLTAIGRIAPVHLIPGNHDTQWWRSPLGIFGTRVLHSKYRRYFGEDLTPVLELDDVIIAGMLSANGLVLGSLTWNPNDCSVKGDLPAAEVGRVRAILAAAPPHKVRLAVLHHNVLPGVVSHRWGLARPHAAQRALAGLGADLVLCGHDHTEGAGLLEGGTVVSTSGTHSVRTRGGRPSAFNLLRIDERRIDVEFFIYAREARTFRQGETASFARPRRAAGSLGG